MVYIDLPQERIFFYVVVQQLKIAISEGPFSVVKMPTLKKPVVINFNKLILK